MIPESLGKAFHTQEVAAQAAATRIESLGFPFLVLETPHGCAARRVNKDKDLGVQDPCSH